MIGNLPFPELKVQLDIQEKAQAHVACRFRRLGKVIAVDQRGSEISVIDHGDIWRCVGFDEPKERS